MAKKYRADQVGSFLRPAEVKEAHAARANGTLSDERVREIEDAAILRLLDMQRATKIEVLSDGEFRRPGWASGFQAAVDGYVEGTPAVSLNIQVPGGGTVDRASVPGSGSNAFAGFRRVIGGKLVSKRRITAHEAGFLQQHANGQPFKATMPAVSYVVARAYNPEITGRVYPTHMDVLRDAAGIVHGEIAALIGEGVPYIQLDNPHYTDYLEEGLRDRWQAIGIDPRDALKNDIEADNLCLRGHNRANVTLAMHLCRGNAGRGQAATAGFHKTGGYDWVAEQLFSSLEVDTFLLEYDSDRSGSFEPLRYMPKGKIVVLGLVTTKSGELESADDVRRRIDEAAKYVALDDLCLSPQCGFASTEAGNPLTEDQERRKLELVVEVARQVWG